MIQLSRTIVADVARAFDPDGQRDLTRAAYKALEAGGDYEWVIDGCTSPPECRFNGGPSVTLKQDDFDALAKLIHAMGVASFSPKELFPASANQTAAKRRVQLATKKIEPLRRRGDGGAFSCIRGAVPRYKFAPSTQLRYCLIERVEQKLAEPSSAMFLAPPFGVMRVDGWPEHDFTAAAPSMSEMVFGGTSPEPWTQSFGNVELLGGLDASVRRKPRPKLRVPKFTPTESPEHASGVEVRVRSIRVVDGRVRAHVTITNRTPMAKLVAYFTLHVGDHTSHAFVPQQTGEADEPRRGHGARRRPTKRRFSSALNPMMPLEVGGVVAGVLVFPLPTKQSGAATIRPHVFTGAIEG